MASMKNVLKQLKVLLKDLEEDLFEDHSMKMLYKGTEYSRGDWKNIYKAVDRVIDFYESGTKKSVKYLKNNPEYNRVCRMLVYYKSKEHKTSNDFDKLEELQKKMQKIIKEREEEKRENERNKFLEIERERESYAKEPRVL